jgi:hypothetical protein
MGTSGIRGRSTAPERTPERAPIVYARADVAMQQEKRHSDKRVIDIRLRAVFQAAFSTG